MSRSFTRKELARYNGKQGKPAYVAADGKVYDVSKSALWQDDTHMGHHVAGHDLSLELNAAPHGEEVLARSDIEQVGSLTVDLDEHLPGFLRSVLKRFPMARRHLHPISIHFPTAFFIAAALFTFVHLIHPNWLNVDFETIAVVMLVLGVLLTPVAVVTGMLTWWVNYSLARTPFVVRKLIFTTTLLSAEVACLVMKRFDFTQHPGAKWIYTGLICWLAINVMILGYYGGQMVFPTKKSPGRSQKGG